MPLADPSELTPRTLFVRVVTSRSPWVHALAFGVFVLATVLAYGAGESDRPRTAAAVYILGVTFVGAIEGLWGGLLAALLASLIYNFFMTVPLYRFTFSTLEELVPLAAFLLCAAASGLLTGWLKDRAQAAELARQRLGFLFEISRALQTAVTPAQVLEAIAPFFAERPEISLFDGDALQPVGGEGAGHRLAQRLAAKGGERVEDSGRTAFLLASRSGRVGVLVLARPRDGAGALADAEDGAAFLNLLGIALERCLLLDRLARAELVERSEAYKTALLSSVSHDLRTPLSAIHASASSLAELGSELTEETRRDLLDIIQEQCDRLNRFTTNLLALGRVQAGIDPALFVSCDAIEVLGSAIARVRALGSGHDIVKDYAVAAGPVRADPVMLEQVFYNILENAVRYTDPAQPVRVLTAAADGALRVTISDGGPGIPEEERAHVFERFYRGRSGAGSAGSGLGLSIARGFVEAFGGSIAVAQAPGSGTAVTVALPELAPAEPA